MAGMKQSKSSNTVVSTDAKSSQSRERTTNIRLCITRHSKIIKSVIALICLALLITVYVLAHRSFSNRFEKTESAQSLNVRESEVEILDGAGSMKAAQQIRNILRSKGYDIVEMKKNNSGIVERTFVLDRSGNLDVARKLATDLGVSQDKVFQKIDHNLYLDMTVVVGKDFSQLKAFKLFTERNMD